MALLPWMDRKYAKTNKETLMAKKIYEPFSPKNSYI